MVLQLFVNGPPGSGKTTLSKLLCEEFNLELIATGELLRKNIEVQTTSGRRAQRCIAAKKLVPDRVVLDMVEAKVTNSMARGRSGWVLDGFPRTTDQAKSLMAKSFLCPAVVFLLDLSEANCVARMSGRRFDPMTGEIFHSPSNLPKDSVVRARLISRQTDTNERLSPRFEAYRSFGEATNDLFVNSPNVVVHRIDATKTSDAIVEDVAALLHSLAATSRHPLTDIFTSKKDNNQHYEEGNAKMQCQKRPDTIPEILAEDDDDMQRYQYDENDKTSSNPNKCQSPHKQELVTKPHPLEEKNRTGEKISLSSSLIAALPLPDMINEQILPPPVPVPALRPLPTPNRITRFRGPQEALKSSVQSLIVHEATNARSISCSSVQSNNSTTSLETAAASVDMETFKELLLDGFEAIKHGRRGRPHPRLLYTDLNFKRVFWQKAMGAADRIGKGKYARLEQSIVLSDVIQIVRGMKTAVLKRSGNVARYDCFVSLVTPTRTLDMELPNPQLADFLQRGFDQLLLH